MLVGWMDGWIRRLERWTDRWAGDGWMDGQIEAWARWVNEFSDILEMEGWFPRLFLAIYLPSGRTSSPALLEKGQEASFPGF